MHPARITRGGPNLCEQQEYGSIRIRIFGTKEERGKLNFGSIIATRDLAAYTPTDASLERNVCNTVSAVL
ncbi:hypothetical protein HBI55_240630 [Parastagonospora nodorum]|nr:hypothetical protein HBI55_240630 [Parastagonospora nodorum]